MGIKRMGMTNCTRMRVNVIRRVGMTNCTRMCVKVISVKMGMLMGIKVNYGMLMEGGDD